MGNKPVIQYGVETLKHAGITEIAVVLGDFNCGDIVEFLGNGSKFGVKLTYYYQGEAKGIAHGVNCAKDFVTMDDKDYSEGFIVYLGDSVFTDGSVDAFIKCAQKFRPSVGVLLSEVKDPQRFGVATFNKYGSVIKITEKPQTPDTNLVLTGCYYFKASFFDIFETLTPSPRGEYEMTDVINILLERNEIPVLTGRTEKDAWNDAGTFESLWETERRLRA